MLRAVVFLATTLLASGATVPKTAPASDTSIEAVIRAKFAKSKINEEHFKVTVKSGVALIEGKTSIPQRKGVATRLARTGGAREVVNKIEVSAEARQKLADRLQKAREARAAAPKLTPKPTPVSRAATRPAPAAASAPVASAATDAPPTLRRMQIKR